MCDSVHRHGGKLGSVVSLWLKVKDISILMDYGSQKLELSATRQGKGSLYFLMIDELK